ncbi:DUF5677 domain-containing protein [Rhizobium leguminosarum]|uniref:DUF5677 domain-containing protein n=1 Tax=Rhizobium leguminosarum TaxID=384 RepID=UPI001C90A83E|nr:DUF5677 domain-containing protein [Rhizobium leguminosarum]MBY2983101.1 hypothetical protein [Rhizobium leguminosarum]
MTDMQRHIIQNLIPVKEAAGVLGKDIETLRSYEWSGPEEKYVWEWLKRSILVRQFEALETIIFLAENNRGPFGVTMLRPAYEEYLWAKYLEKHETFARKISLLLLRREIDDTVDAQNVYLGAKTMQHLGFTQKRIKQMQASFRPGSTELREIGRALKWRNEQPPGAAALARETGDEREYNFIYHATSRYVHFSTHELCRRVWGQKGKVKIGSDQFSGYWTDFALYWAFRIFIYTCREFVDIWPGEDDSSLEALLPSIEKLSPVPIITSSELESW